MSTQPVGIEHYIQGRVVPGSSGRTQDVTNPATGAVTGKVALASSAEVDAAVEAAAAAFPKWADNRCTLAVGCCALCLHETIQETLPC